MNGALVSHGTCILKVMVNNISYKEKRNLTDAKGIPTTNRVEENGSNDDATLDCEFARKSKCSIGD